MGKILLGLGVGRGRHRLHGNQPGRPALSVFLHVCLLPFRLSQVGLGELVQEPVLVPGGIQIGGVVQQGVLALVRGVPVPKPGLLGRGGLGKLVIGFLDVFPGGRGQKIGRRPRRQHGQEDDIPPLQKDPKQVIDAVFHGHTPPFGYQNK